MMPGREAGGYPVWISGVNEMNVVVVDYKAGNLYNVGNALKHLGVEFVFSDDPMVLQTADRVILPGVGSARSAMDSLNEKKLVSVLKNLKVPFLGICLGLQLLFELSEENSTPCLGVFSGQVRRFDSRAVKVPHIGWNQIVRCNEKSKAAEVLLRGVPDSCFFYFVHSFFAPVTGSETLAVTEYGGSFASIVARQNFYGVQFHPERSGEIGLRLLSNFLELDCQ